jgi:hypothetical protein
VAKAAEDGLRKVVLERELRLVEQVDAGAHDLGIVEHALVLADLT